MRLRELLCGCDFDDIVPHILRIYPKHKTQLPWYKEAYDILCHMEHTENNGIISVEWVKDNIESNPYIYIGNCEGDFWKSNLGKQLEIADDVNISNAELAARCLWSLTFYGYSPDDCSYFDNAPRNRYEEQAEQLEDRQFSNYARTKKGDSLDPFKRALEEWKVYDYRRQHRNRAKRMRDHRQNIRIKQLKRWGEIEYDINQILERTQNIARTDLDYLFNTKLIRSAVYHSHSYDRSRRLPYLLEVLTHYDVDMSSSEVLKYTHVVIVISTDPAAPIETCEMVHVSDILKYINSRCLDTKVIREFGTKEGLGDEIELLMVCSY